MHMYYDSFRSLQDDSLCKSLPSYVFKSSGSLVPWGASADYAGGYAEYYTKEVSIIQIYHGRGSSLLYCAVIYKSG